MATLWSPGSLGTVQLAVCSTIIAATLSFATSLVNADPREKSEATQQAAPTEGIPEIVVKGAKPSIERRINVFVAEITPQASSHESLARWRKPICPLVEGLPDEQSEVILERVSQAAISAGAPLATEDCRVNFYIVVTAEPYELLQSWRERERRLFGDASRSTIDRFLNRPRPIRVWYNTESDRFHIRPQGTRLEWPVIINLSSVIVVVDAGRVKGIGLDQVAGYIAMTGLVMLDPGADLGGAPTILRLFVTSNDVVPKRMTSWDRAFLKAVYQTRQKSRFQRSHIVSRMVDDVAPR